MSIESLRLKKWMCIRNKQMSTQTEGFWGRVLTGIFGLRRRKWREAGEDGIMRSFITCRLH